MQWSTTIFYPLEEPKYRSELALIPLDEGSGQFVEEQFFYCMPSYWTCRSSVTLCRRRLLLVGYYEDVFVFVFQLLTLTGFSSREGEGYHLGVLLPANTNIIGFFKFQGIKRDSPRLNSTPLNSPPPLPLLVRQLCFLFFSGGGQFFPTHLS